ncbi:hypothetical protein [Pseudacidovorax intermedius]|uniref:Uncharacterized protein n=1 Tax=Pseudacidovorax intermedius TaxID=433924 RepID=A0A147GW81_9BURK|nr:hypothetical protein [Pseudacidovorax intermedius]KTT21895.1 hypothetical protein NS331_11070 [Pseudacidovorax intermedius]
MSDTPQADKAAKELTAAEAAKRVSRPIYEQAQGKDESGAPILISKLVKRAPVKVDEVLSFKDYGTHVVVVTTDGQKFSSLDGKDA